MLGRSCRSRDVPGAERHRALRSLTLVALLGVLSLMVASSAFAASAHRYVGQLGGTPWGGGPGDLGYPVSVSTDPVNGDVYVADAAFGRVQVYSASGDPIAQLNGSATPNGSFSGMGQVGVDHAADRVYVPEPGGSAVDIFSTSGAPAGQLDPSATPAGTFNGPGAVAVDPATGDVYVADTNNNVVDVFASDGTFQSSFDGSSSPNGAFSAPRGVAVDGSSNVYVLDASRVEEFTAGGAAYVNALPPSSPTAVGADLANGDVYVVDYGASGPQVERYDSAGALQEAFGTGRLSGPTGVAISPSGHRAYVSDGNTSSVDIFSPYIAPDVTTGGASGVTSSQATLDGTVNPQGAASYAFLEWGTDLSSGPMSSNWTDVGHGTSDVPVTDTVTGLQPNTTYHYRLTAYAYGTYYHGAESTFTTAAVPPTVDGQPAYASSTTTDATINAFVNPKNSPTQYHFEYGTDTSYGATTPDGDAGSGMGDNDMSATLTGLTPGTTYHYRVVADNGTGGPVDGADATFTTAPAEAPAASDVTAVSSTLNGPLNAAARTYHFEYGTDTSYGTSTATVLAGGAAGPASVTITDLQPATTYHFRLVSNDGPSSAVSDDATFTTDPAPVATTGDATDASTSAATLHGTADTHGLAGTYHFLVTGVGSTVSRTTPEQAVASDGPAAVSAAISDLPDNGTYEVQLVVTASGAEGRGDATTFSTQKATPIVPRQPPTNEHPYGCAAPHLDAPTQSPMPGMAYTLTGSDLGVGGTVTLGGVRAATTGWSATAITIQVPDDAQGSLAVAVDCGTAANAVTLTIAKPPSNAFSVVSARVTGSRVSVTVKLPGAGAVRLGGTYVTTGNRSATAAGTYHISAKLNAAGRKRLAKAKHGRLTVGLAVRYTPKGGAAATTSAHATFKRVARKG